MQRHPRHAWPAQRRRRIMSEQLRRTLCQSVDGGILMGHMRELAQWVKLSGTPDELTSLRYFQAKLDEYGYQTNLIMHDAYISLPGKARVDVDNHTLTIAGRERPSGVSRRRRRSGLQGARPARRDRADGRHRQPRPGGARLARG